MTPWVTPAQIVRAIIYAHYYRLAWPDLPEGIDIDLKEWFGEGEE